MTKGLEAFRDILGILSAVSGCEVDMNSERIQTITKELKALEIIKKHNPQICENYGAKEHRAFINVLFINDYEEFKFVYEVLCDEQV